MPTINPALVPTIAPGNIFSRLTTDTTLNVRWLTPTDPVLFEAINRPLADIVLRQLIIAKALDNIDLRLSFLSIFPFLIPPKVIGGSSQMDLPLAWIWDMHPSSAAKWQYMRLAKIKRISGTNPAGGTAGSYTGYLRLIFTAQTAGSVIETSLFYVDYKIDSAFTYQFAKVNVVTSAEESNAIDPAEAGTIAGWVIFRTLDQTDPAVTAFYDLLQPPAVPVIGPDGFYTNRTVYEMADSSVDPETFFSAAVVHGSGMLVVSAYNPIPSMDSDFNTWLASNNYPFRIGASRTSVHGIVIPSAIFREFNIVAPSADEPTGDTSKQNSPVWVSSIERIDTLADELRFVFSTYTIVEGDTSPQIMEFAALVLHRAYIPGQVVGIQAISNLLKNTTAEADDFLQGFGTGHVVLSSLWSGSTAEINDFFDTFLAITDVPAITTFAKDSAILSSFAISRVPRYVPTKGQAGALLGSSARFVTPVNPSASNRYVTEADQGLGSAVDFTTVPGIAENVDIENVGYTGGLAHKIVKLVINEAGTSHDYNTDILPRLRCLLGRDPAFGDFLYTGTYLKFYNGDSWIAL